MIIKKVNRHIERWSSRGRFNISSHIVWIHKWMSEETEAQGSKRRELISFIFLAGSKKPIFEIPSKRVNWSTIVLRLTLQFPHAAETSEKHRYCFQTLIEKLSKIIWLASSCLPGERIEATKWNLFTFRVSITSWMMSCGDLMFNHTINTACITDFDVEAHIRASSNIVIELEPQTAAFGRSLAASLKKDYFTLFR